jgi:hypothetical protein
MCYTDYVQRNVTLTIEEDLLREARKVAIDRHTSVNRMIREYLARVVEETGQRRTALARVEEAFRSSQVEIGPRTWARDELHER